MKFNDLRIAVRLAIAFATITLLIAFLGFAAHKALSNVAGDWGSFISVSMEKRESATQGMLKLGDTIRIEMKGKNGESVFGAIEQEVTASEEA